MKQRARQTEVETTKGSGVKLMGLSESVRPIKCAYCGKIAKHPLKFRSGVDKKTVRICKEHWNNMAKNLRAWDEFTALNFPKWGLRCYGRKYYEEHGLLNLIEFKKKQKAKAKGVKRARHNTKA